MLGTGIIKGLAETARNFVGSYHDPERLTTRQYPEERPVLPENSRSFPFLVYDEEPEPGLRCVACLICEKECPPKCIYIVPERDEKGRVQKRPRIFDIDISVCMSCQICVEVCPFDAIKMDTQYEYSRSTRFDELLLHKAALAKSNQYYRQIHPAEAAGVDAQLAEAKARQQAKAATPPPAPLQPPAQEATPAGAGTNPPPATDPAARP
jgi:NADH-quinone oxidoreductase subunit I